MDYVGTMKLKDFERLSRFIETELGIKMPTTKKTMIESRLQKRLRILGLKSFDEYCEYLFSGDGMEEELVHMIDMVTTNKTDFFRESSHFDYLVQKVLPEMIKESGSGVMNTFMAWSAGCSTGEEPYTLAMVLSEFGLRYPGLSFQYMILATDISTRVLQAASKATYAEDRISPISLELRKKYLLRSRDREQGLVRFVPELRSHVRFRRLNFLEGDFGMREQFDVIFCRNVFIYFDKQTQEDIMSKFCRHLKPGGYIFIGQSESFTGTDLPLKRVNPSVYKKVA
ncbi:MAG: protein-glutamate O-methyltransferase [Nitrospirae bacterium]|nr:protein-glutamate O-methyltransferase [Nitrospirota bacterium]